MQAEQKHKIFRNLFVGLIFIAFGLMFVPFFTPILLASVFAFALQGYVTKIESKRISRSWACVILLVGLILFVALPSTIVIVKVTSKLQDYAAVGFQNTAVYNWTLDLIHKATDYIESLAQTFNYDLSSLPKPIDLLNDYAGSIGAFATGFLTRLPKAGLSLLVFLVALFYFLNEARTIKKFFVNLELLPESELNKIIKVLKDSSWMAVGASLVIATMQATIISVAAYFTGFEDFLMIFIITFVFSLIPVVGCAPPAIFLIIVAFGQGNMVAVIALNIALVIASSSDNVFKAYALNSANEEIHPIISLLGLLGAIFVYGAPGILLGPIITQLAFNILPIVNERLNPEENQKVSDF